MIILLELFYAGRMDAWHRGEKVFIIHYSRVLRSSRLNYGDGAPSSDLS